MYANSSTDTEFSPDRAEPLDDAANATPAPSQPIAEKEFQRELLKMMPQLNAFSVSLCKDRELAKDLAQETLCKAWQARTRFQQGTNLRAWLFTILRNLFYTHGRKAWRQVNYDDMANFDVPGPDDQQNWALILSDLVRGLRGLPPEQRKAVMMVGPGGLSYADVATFFGWPEGTVKSRVARGRALALAALDGLASLSGPRPPIGRADEAIMGDLANIMAR